MPIVLTESRRRIVARTLFDVFKIESAAVFASNFFVDLGAIGRGTVFVLTLVAGILAIRIYPPEDKE